MTTKLVSTGVEFPDATTQTTTGLPLTGGTMTGTIAGFTSTGIDDNATSTAITIDASENVGIGTASPVAKLEINDDATNTTLFKITAADDAPYGFILGNDTYSVGETDGIAMYVTNAGVCNIQANGTGASLKFTGDAAFTGDLVMAAGKGIDFSATAGTGTSELLDDYETGTFTPTFSSGFTGITYLLQKGRYTKIGDVVNYTIALAMSAATAAGSQIQISGLPFTSDATDGYGGAYFSYCPFIDGSTISRLALHTPVNNNKVLFYTNTAVVTGNNSGVVPTGTLVIMGSYSAA